MPNVSFITHDNLIPRRIQLSSEERSGWPSQLALAWDPLIYTKDESFEALANGWRRTLLVALSWDNPQDVAAHVLGSGDDGGSIPDQQAWVEMYHVHLPKLDDHGFIRRDRDAGEVTRGPQFEEIQPLLERVTELANGETTPQ